MVDAVRVAQKAVGKVTYERTPKEEAGLAFRRSLFFARDLPSDHAVTMEDTGFFGQAMAWHQSI